MQHACQSPCRTVQRLLPLTAAALIGATPCSISTSEVGSFPFTLEIPRILLNHVLYPVVSAALAPRCKIHFNDCVQYGAIHVQMKRCIGGHKWRNSLDRYCDGDC